ncbi:uncharacterized protein LOC143487725, partial [Brachyhypopomus gauderio]|uniref:uncharacterized protein LOC143487725 n=1 Tax=Brachyhypopomus gauderio TaxID=698409 RepID=UPI0040433561
SDPPRVPSVTDRVSGDLITLLCYSDSNPNSTYTWYRKTGSDVIPIENGTSLTLNASTVGPFYCEVKNHFGSSNSTEWSFTADNTTVMYTAAGVTVGLFLVLVAALLWMRSQAAAPRSRREENSVKLRTDHDSTPVYGNSSALAMTSDPTHSEFPTDQDDVQYGTVYFTRNQTQEVSPSATTRHIPGPPEEEDVQYASVNFKRLSAATLSAGADDPCQIYSQVHKPKPHT